MVLISSFIIENAFKNQAQQQLVDGQFQNIDLYLKARRLKLNNIKIMAQKANEFKAQGNAAFQAGKFEQAVKHFTSAIQLNPNDHVFFSNRSGAYASMKKYEEALGDANKCIEINPKWAKGYQRKGLAEYYLDKLPEAIDTYKKGLEIEPGNAQLKESLANAENQLKGGDDDMGGGFDINAMLKNPQAMQMMLKLMSNPETKSLFQDPSFMQTLQVLMSNPAALATLAQKDPRIKKVMEVINSPSPAGEPDFASMFGGAPGGAGPGAAPKPPKTSSKMEEEEPQKKPEPPKEEKKPEKPKEALSPAEDWKNKGNDEYSKKNFEKALECYDEAIKLTPSEVIYYSNKAAAYIELGQLDKALECVNAGIHYIEDGTVKDYVKKAKILARKGSILAKLEKFDEAITAYEKSLVEDSKPQIKDELSKVKKLKKDVEAKAYINPEIAEKHCEEGNKLFKEGKYPDSVKEYEEAIRRNPNVAKYHSNLGTVYIKLMEFVRGRDSLDRALAIDPNYVKAYAKKGDCHFYLKEYHKALDTYEKGLKIEQDNEACIAGIKKTQMAIITANDKEGQEERAKHAMADPEIQAILKSPEIQTVLNDLQNDPKSASKAFQNPVIAERLNKLIASGILRMG